MTASDFPVLRATTYVTTSRVTVNSGVQVSSQAAFLLTSLSSTPSMNFTPAMTSAS